MISFPTAPINTFRKNKMEQGYKHFSHSHSLIIHQLPEGIEVSCFGCNSSGTGTVFVCWQCNFFLHEQCYRATRSLKHPSHPSHPLTLVPFPTYPSNSFYCNSCESVGTGLSYSCADCEFDLHVQCAYSISRATSFRKTHQYQEPVPPGWNGVHSSIITHSAQDPYPPPNLASNVQYHPASHDLAYVSVPPSRQNSIPTAQDPPMAHNLASVSIPMSSQNPIPSAPLYPSIDQSGPSFTTPNNPPNSSTSVQIPSIPQSRPSVSIPLNSQNLIASTQYHSMAQSGQSVSVPANYPSNPSQDPSNPQSTPSVSIPTSSQNQIASTRPSVSNPTNYPSDPIPISQDPSMPQSGPISIHASSQNPTAKAQYPSVDTEPSVSISTNPPNTVSSFQDPQIHQNAIQDKGIMHFSHPHILSIVDLQEDEEDEITCSGCEETIVGKGYSCVKQKCDFHLHESCFHLKQEIQHKSHPEHPLILLPLAPYNNENREFTCNACFSDGTGFTYHCSVCKFDLHIQCVSLPETMKRDDHEHELKLYYSCPVKGDEYVFSCDVCHGDIEKDRWVYYCDSCDYGTHLGCVDCEECEGDSNIILDPQAQLQNAQFQLQLARQQAQFLSSLGASLSSLAG